MPAPSRRDALTHLGTAAVLGGTTAARADAPKAGKKPIKIGQIGVAHAHATKLSVYRDSPDYEVVGIVEPDEALRKRAENAPAYRGLKWLTREQLLATPGLQAVLVETRIRDLLDNAEACVRAGMHVHIDKPAGESLPHLKRVLDAATKQKLVVQMGYMYRYNPAVVLLREFLKKGWLGEVFEVHAVMSKVVPPAQRKEHAEYPGGMMFELGCHVLDLVVGVLGRPNEVAGFRTHAAKLDDGLLDNMLAVLSYPRAIASVKSSALEVEGGDRRHLVVCGTEGTFHIQPLDNPAARVSLSQARDGYKKGTQEVTFPKYARYVGDAADMARVIRGEKPHDFPPEHDLAVQETLLRACGLSPKN
ncbi:Gfo/Idh/MocA family oxidoreductase [Gemmata sp. JC717]|uniref:Gfo/Idh/MocA family protein n=1 Tax=Gemmata algarum TaxID=2975278 RepID=UPI0021BB86F0|nr:Gfo/Idh/MocA family oxidoreductase [Gemmata algarum]MDY3551829.1 Gfo/Idh/MocA family oxidoreductase [Gemmata algarum]